MADLLGLLVAVAAGGAIAALSLGGLWLTVRRLPTARRPTLLVLVSFAARLTMAVVGFALVLQGDPWRALAAVVGFLAVRTAWVRAVRPTGDVATPVEPAEVEP